MHDPERFEMNKSFIVRDADKFVSQLMKDMTWDKYNERICDYGCGAGSTGFNHILPQVYLHDAHLYSVDISEAMISYASMKYPHPCVTYAIGDIMSENYPFKYIKFDKIFSVYVMQFIKDYKDAIGRFYEGLKPGGQFGFTTVTNYFCYYLHQELGKMEKWTEYMEGYENFVPEVYEHNEDAEQAYRTTLEAKGFEILKLTTHKLEWTFDKLDTALEFYLAISPFTKTIPEELYDDLKQDCRELMTKTYYLNPESDSFDMKYQVLYCLVKKPGDIVVKHHHKTPKHRIRWSLP